MARITEPFSVTIRDHGIPRTVTLERKRGMYLAVRCDPPREGRISSIFILDEDHADDFGNRGILYNLCVRIRRLEKSLD